MSLSEKKGDGKEKKRNNYSVDFKAKVALAAPKNEKTNSQLASPF